MLLQRARLNAAIRRFFEGRDVLEVETPLLCRHGVTDPNLSSFTTAFNQPAQVDGLRLYLQTSPEFAMKRLLASGCGSIYQICKAFRNEEAGRHHNPEFTLLEWYRTGFGLPQLLDEIESLLQHVSSQFGLGLAAPERFSYRCIFERHIGADPLTASLAELDACANRLGLAEAVALCGDDRTVWLDLLFSYFVQPHLGQGRLTSVTHYPDFMPSLARPSLVEAGTVERVEIFLSGLELGNGFHELADPVEQARRFEHDRAERRRLGRAVPDMDGRLLAALEAGLPDCAGMAIGLDRLLMVLTESASLAEVLTFPVELA